MKSSVSCNKAHNDFLTRFLIDYLHHNITFHETMQNYSQCSQNEFTRK